MYPFYEKLVKWSKTTPSLANVCIHKGLYPPATSKEFPDLLPYADVRDVAKAAKDWPQLNFVIYHSAFQRAALENDVVAVAKASYDKYGDGRTNLRYGYMQKPAAQIR